MNTLLIIAAVIIWTLFIFFIGFVVGVEEGSKGSWTTTKSETYEINRKKEGLDDVIG